LSLLAIALMVSACTRKEQKAAQQKAAQRDKGAMVPQGAGQPAARPRERPHPGLVRAVRTAIPCIKKTAYETTKCMEYNLAAWLARNIAGQAGGEARLLVTLASLARAADPQTVNIASNLIRDRHTLKAFRRLAAQEAVPRSAALDLLEGYKKAKGWPAFNIAHGAVIVAGAVGLHERLWAIAEKHENPFSKKYILKHIMSQASMASSLTSIGELPRALALVLPRDWAPRTSAECSGGTTGREGGATARETPDSADLALPLSREDFFFFLLKNPISSLQMPTHGAGRNGGRGNQFQTKRGDNITWTLQ
jgi:hypothetical protein